MNLLFWRKPQPKSKPLPEPTVFYGLGLTVRAQQWRQNAALVSEALAHVSSPRFQQMLEVLRNEDPARFPLATGSTLQDRAVHQAMSEGYSLAVETLLALAKPWPTAQALEETFEVEITHKENEKEQDHEHAV